MKNWVEFLGPILKNLWMFLFNKALTEGELLFSKTHSILDDVQWSTGNFGMNVSYIQGDHSQSSEHNTK